MTAMGAFDTNGLSMRGATKVATALESTAADRARRSVATMALDADDCRELLDMLGLLPSSEEVPF